jgi:hypothetical protein
MNEIPFYCELQDRAAMSDDARFERAVRYENFIAHINTFVVRNIDTVVLHDGEARNTVIKLYTSLAYLSTLPSHSHITVSVYKSLPRQDPRRFFLLLICAFARGIHMRLERLANDNDWMLWLDTI